MKYTEKDRDRVVRAAVAWERDDKTHKKDCGCHLCIELVDAVQRRPAKKGARRV